ncbi:MAG TPA: ACT domain-containing protein [Mucilaginibacter sp.]
MSGETNLNQLLRTMSPELKAGDYVFCTVNDVSAIDRNHIIGSFKEAEGWTIILEKEQADKKRLSYSYIAAWITLTVHSSLETVGLTAAFATALGNAGISCNVVAAFYHDHIFVAKKDAERAMEVLRQLSQ